LEFAFNQEQKELQRSARAFLRDHSSSEQVRQAMGSELGYDTDVWERMANELGWPALTIPEAYGGYGLGQVELAVLMEEMGAVLLCSPFFSSVCLAANALIVGGSEEQKARYLPAIASGSRLATLALGEVGGQAWTAEAVQATARPEGGDFILEGIKTYVPDGHTAALFLIAARSPGSNGEQGISLFAVPADTVGLEVKALATMDQTRRQAEVSLGGVRVPASSLLGQQGQGWSVIRPTLDLAAVALSAEQVGGAQACLDMTVAYAKERRQFGREIGSFQAIKHKLADMMLLVESARSASYYAAWAASQGSSELPQLASLAKAYCSDAYFHCAAESIQIHGGVGFTWEYDVHLYFKRARSSESLLGDAPYHRELVARSMGL
jgi:alkylation response protein AidB-like acyl-CoA dehydrogenase